MKLLLVDLDGTVRETISGDTFINDPLDQQLITGVKETLAFYKTEGWTIVGITNQGGVLKGYKTIDNCITEQLHTLKIALYIEAIYFCPDEGDNVFCCEFLSSPNLIRPQTIANVTSHSRSREDKYDSFRKPSIGMIQLAKNNFSSELIEDILFVGDRPEDQLAAQNADIPFLWANEWRIIAFSS